MNTPLARSGFYMILLLTPLAATASNPDHPRQNSAHQHQQSQQGQQAQQGPQGLQPLNNNGALPLVSVPEPGALVLLGTGLIGLFVARRKQR